MINRRLLVNIILRFLRKKDALMIWVVRHPDEIRYRVDILAFEGFSYRYKSSERTIYIPNGNRIKFVIEDDREDIIAGSQIDEAIIDES